MNKKPFKSIGAKLVFLILMCSGATTTIFTGISFYMDYRTELSIADALFAQIEVSAVEPMANAYYNVDEDQIDRIAKGVLNITDIIRVDLLDEDGKLEKSFDTKNYDGVDDFFSRWFAGYEGAVDWPLIHEEDGQVGMLRVVATKRFMYGRLASKALYFFLSQGLKTLIVSGLILLIVSSLVTGHIKRVIEYWDNQDMGSKQMGEPLELNRHGKTRDEIDNLVENTNNAFTRLWRLNREVHTELEETRTNASKAMNLASLSDMAAGVAHEINNPLAIISGSSELIENSLERDAPQDHIVKNTKRIKNTVGRISTITKALLDYSRDTSQDPLQPVFAEQLLQRVEGVAKATIRFGEVKFIVNSDGLSSVTEINCRESQVVQAVVNVVKNGVYAALLEPSSDAFVVVTGIEVGGFVEIVVGNTGSKIEEESRAKIFNPFFTTKPVGQGTGLGLPISLGLAESNGGTLEFAHESKQTTFVFRFPKYISNTA